MQPSHLAEVRAIANRFEEQLDKMVDAAWENYLCLLHLWSRLRVWMPCADVPIAPPDAGTLFLD
jgi:hypothetical protein